MHVSAQSKLNKQSRFSYKSFSISSQLDDGSSPKDFTTGLTKKYDLIRLKELPVASGSLHLSDKALSSLKETDGDRSNQDKLIPLYAVSVIFAVGVTFALVLQICLGESLDVAKGVVVSDHEHCTALGQRVLHDGGSSVDAAIAGALCLGVMHPHVSGVGGGGVMLVHDILKNETKVINFQGTAPKALRKEMLQNVSEHKAGLKVCVPGMLMGLHRAHSIYGSLSWEDVVGRAADVARDGFNVSHSLSDAISKVKGELLSQRFRDMFIPGGRALSPGSYVRMPGLAGVLEAGLNNFYHGNVSQEIEDEVRESGGILNREDIGNYRVEVEQPLESQYNDFIIQVSPPPSAGAVLISALNLLEAFHLSENNITENQTYHKRAEALKEDLAKVRGVTDHTYIYLVTELLSDMLSKSRYGSLRQKTNYSRSSPSEYFSTNHSLQTGLMIGQVVVTGPDNLMVSVASSLSRTFGSRIVTPSGIILNSLVHDISWTNKIKGQPQTDLKNIVESGQSLPSLLMPTIIMPARHKCGIYMALSSSGGQNMLNTVIQLLNSAFYFHKDKKDSLFLRRHHHHPQTNRILGYSEFPEENERFVHAKGHVVQRAMTNQAVQGIQRNKDAIAVLQVLQLLHSLL